MAKAYAILAGISIIGLAAAHAGAPMQLSDWQMQAVTAGSANANGVFQTSVDGRKAAVVQTSVGTNTAVNSHRSFAQSSTGVLATGTGDASIATDTLNQSTADGHGPAQVATAATAGSASGGTPTVRSVGITTAISASAGPSRSSIGVAESLANIITFSASGGLH